MKFTRRGSQAGTAALETALVAPVFLTLVFGTLNVGWGLYCGAEVRHAVERSTRLLLVDPDTTESTLQTYVRDQLKAANATDVTVTKTTETVGTSGSIARLSWTYAYTIDAPMMKTIRLKFNSSLVTPLRT